MLYDNPFLYCAIALAVLAAFAMPAQGEDLPAPIGVITAGQTPASVDLERFNSSSILSRIRADAAHGRGLTGQGVTIGVLDTGIDARHHEFAETGKLLPGYNAVSGGTDVTDRSGHGTHGAGIIGARRDGKGVFGVAYEAALLPIKVIPDGGNGSTVALDRGLRYSIGKVAIASMSVSSTTVYDAHATQEAVRTDMLLVASAGNNGGANPGWPANFAKESWAHNQIIAVGAVDSFNRIASFSNRAGDAAAWYLVAPGTGIASADPDDHYVTRSGTSMATPMVTADRVRRGDRISVSLSQPMRTYSGRVVMNVLSRSNRSGAARERLVFSMVPVGREIRGQLNYQMPVGFGATFGLALMVRRNPNHLDDAAVETLTAARYMKTF